MTTRLLFKTIVVALIVAALGACERKPPPPLVFGATAWPGYQPVYLARELGYYSGGNLQLADYADASALKQALRQGKVQMAAMPLEDALLLRREIPHLKVVLLFDSAGAGPSGKRLDVLVTRDETIGIYHRDLGVFVQGWRQALGYLQQERPKAIRIMAERQHLAPADFDKSLQGLDLYDLRRNQQMMIGEPPAIGADIVALQRSMLGKGLLSVGEDPSIIVDATLLAEAIK